MDDSYRELSDQLPVPLWMSGPDKARMFFNRAWVELTGRPMAEQLGDGWLACVHPDDIATELVACSAAFAERKPFRARFRLRRADGEYRWVADTAVPRFRPDGEFQGYIGTCIDITDGKQAEDRLEAVLASIDDHLVCYDRNFRYTYVNAGAAQILGKSVAELLGKCIWDLFPSAIGNQYYCELHDALKHSRVIRTEHYYAPFDTWFENHIYPSTDGLTVFSANVTWRKRLEEELRQRADQLAEADRRKDEFLATLAHELRNPLAPIRGSLQLIRLAGNNSDVVANCLVRMERQVELLTRLVDDLLDVSRVTRGKIELQRQPTDLATVLARAIEIMRPAIDSGGHTLTVSLPELPLWVDVDVLRMAQVFANLLANACKYTHRGGNLGVSAGEHDGHVVVRVTDNGIGIPEAMRERIFDVFVQVRDAERQPSGGLGLGLALVKQLVTLHGGMVEAHPGPGGVGSEFVVRMPRAATANLSERRPPKRTLVSGPLVVLVADDNVDGAESVAEYLSVKGYFAHMAHDGASAVSLSLELSPAVMIIDLGMPALSGFEVASRVRARPGGENVLLIAMTGWGQAEDRERARAAGFDHHLVKPANLENIVELIEGWRAAHGA